MICVARFWKYAVFCALFGAILTCIFGVGTSMVYGIYDHWMIFTCGLLATITMLWFVTKKYNII